MILESISFQRKPDNPLDVVLGQLRVSLKWEFTSNSETIQSIYIRRQKPDDIAPSTIASRGPNSPFTKNNNFKDRSNYQAKLNSELVILKVKEHQDYLYTLTINYLNSNGVPQEANDRVLVKVRGK